MPQPFVRIAVQLVSIRPDWVVLPFVVDTGAAFTCIHALDATRSFEMSPASLDRAGWSASVPVGGIGGGQLYLARPANYAFQRDDGELELFTGTVRIGELRTQATPALLGWDLLRFFRTVTNGRERTVTLDRL